MIGGRPQYRTGYYIEDVVIFSIESVRDGEREGDGTARHGMTQCERGSDVLVHVLTDAGLDARGNALRAFGRREAAGRRWARAATRRNAVDIRTRGCRRYRDTYIAADRLSHAFISLVPNAISSPTHTLTQIR